MQIYYLTLNIQVGYLFTLQITFTSHLNSVPQYFFLKSRGNKNSILPTSQNIFLGYENIKRGIRHKYKYLTFITYFKVSTSANYILDTILNGLSLLF